jgi:hypothetical protein
LLGLCTEGINRTCKNVVAVWFGLASPKFCAGLSERVSYGAGRWLPRGVSKSNVTLCPPPIPVHAQIVRWTEQESFARPCATTPKDWDQMEGHMPLVLGASDRRNYRALRETGDS